MFPLYPGDCHDQCAHWSRNDRKFGVSPTNTNLSILPGNPYP